ncbi:hypothetical protein LEP1GSC074_3399 [Leptospira noguchii str. Hook]|nr:hypothetical protein LEP1GSC074_3399 [Leptospira noguchii str. Hook]
MQIPLAAKVFVKLDKAPPLKLITKLSVRIVSLVVEVQNVVFAGKFGNAAGMAGFPAPE